MQSPDQFHDSSMAILATGALQPILAICTSNIALFLAVSLEPLQSLTCTPS